MTNIPSQRTTEPGFDPDPPLCSLAEAGLGPDSVVELDDGTSMTLRELLGETPEDDDE
jgi:hypothetical protein